MQEGSSPAADPQARPAGDDADLHDFQPPRREKPPRPGRFRRALARVGAGLGLGLCFVGSAATALVLHVDRPASRRIARDVTNRVLATVFEGRIVVDEIERISVDGVAIRSAVALEPRGGHAIRASGIRARIDVLELARRALSGPEVRIEIPFVRVEHAEVLVEVGPAGKVTLEETFTPRPPLRPPAPKPPGAPPSRPVRVVMPRIEVGHAWVHGTIAPPRSLDADVTRLAASVQVGPEGLAVDAAPAGVHDRSLLPAPVAGTADYHLRVAGGEPRMWSSFAGRIGRVEAIARAQIDGSFLTATGDVPRATPEELATVLPGLTLSQPIAASVSISGPIPRFDVEARVSVHERVEAPARGALAVAGGIDATGPLHVSLDFDGRDLDPALFGPALEPIAGARVSSSGRFVAVLDDGGPFIEVTARTSRTIVRGHSAPPASVHLVMYRGRVFGDVAVEEPGMDVSSSFDMSPDGAVRFDAQAEIPRVSGAPRIAGPVDGRVSVRTRGELSRGRLDADVTARVSGVRAPGDVAMETGTVRGRVFGPVDALEIDAHLVGRGMRAGGYEFETVDATAKGPIASPRMRSTLEDLAGGKVFAAGRLDARAGAVRDLTLELERDSERVTGKIARVGPAGGGLAIEGVSFSGEGVGSLTGNLRVRGDDVTGTLKGEGVDLERVGKLVGLPLRVKGLANLDIALSRGKSGRSGHVMIELENGELPLLPGLSANVTAKFEDDRMTADGLVRLVAVPRGGSGGGAPECNGTIASIRFSKGEGTLAGPLLSAKTWANVTGSVEVAAERWDIACLERLSPVRAPLSELAGTVTTRFKLVRPADQRFVSIRDFSFHTNGLVIAGPRDPHDEHPSWESRNIDFALKGSLEGDSGKTHAVLTIFDGQILADVTLDAELDLARLWERPAERRAAIESAPIAIKLAVPRRPVAGFSTLPTFVHPYLPKLAGDVRIDAYADGTLREPFVAVRAKGWNLALTEDREGKKPSEWAMPVDLDAVATYDDDRASLTASASHAGRTIASASAEIVTDLPQLVAPKPGERPVWIGGFVVELEDVPLGDVPRFGDSDLSGKLRGTIAATRLNERPTLSVDLGVADLKIGDDRFESASFKLQVQRGAEEGKDLGVARVALREEGGGTFAATGYAGVVWKERVVPALDFEQRADLHAEARGFHIAAFHPLVSDVLSKLDGRLDGTVRIGWARLAEGDEGAIQADMRVRDGVFHLPQIGQEFRNASVRIRTSPPMHLDDETTIHFEDLRAVGISGEIKGSAQAFFDGLVPKSVEGKLTIDEKQKLPITLEGVPLGRAHGNLSFVATWHKEQREVYVDLKIPNMHLDLPATPAKAVQPLDDHPEIDVSHPLGPKKDARSSDALVWRTDVTLGKIDLEGAGVSLALTTKGKPMEIRLTDEMRITGDIHIVEGGRVDVFGKTFEIERGLVRMREEDASNPYLSVTAHWPGEAIDVYVDYQGTLKPITKEKVKFRSTPALPEDRIMLVLLGRDVDGSGADALGDDAGVNGYAAAAGGNVAAAQLNQLLSGTFLRGVSTSVGASEEGTMKTSVSYQLGETVTAGASYEQAQQNARAGASSTESTGGRTELTIDWRFHRNWSVRARVGNDSRAQTSTESGVSSGVDLLWQYRY